MPKKKARPKDRTILLGEVGVDSGQLMICDPSYVNLFQDPDSEGMSDHAHEICRDVKDGSLWQFTYGEKPSHPDVTAFPGSYADIIPKYGKCPNDLIKDGIWEQADIDPTPHIPEGEFSYRGICKVTKNFGGQLNYPLGHSGVAVAFRSGLGDGIYKVKAVVGDVPGWGKRVKKVIIELVPHPYDIE